MNLNQISTQLEAFLTKNRSNLSDDDVKLLDEIIHQIRDIPSIRDDSIRKDLIRKCCIDMMRFLSIKKIAEKTTEILEDIKDYI